MAHVGRSATEKKEEIYKKRTLGSSNTPVLCIGCMVPKG